MRSVHEGFVPGEQPHSRGEREARPRRPKLGGP